MKRTRPFRMMIRTSPNAPTLHTACSRRRTSAGVRPCTESAARIGVLPSSADRITGRLTFPGYPSWHRSSGMQNDLPGFSPLAAAVEKDDTVHARCRGHCDAPWVACPGVQQIGRDSVVGKVEQKRGAAVRFPLEWPLNSPQQHGTGYRCDERASSAVPPDGNPAAQDMQFASRRSCRQLQRARTLRAVADYSEGRHYVYGWLLRDLPSAPGHSVVGRTPAGELTLAGRLETMPILIIRSSAPVVNKEEAWVS
jgi:hypothetical protein